MADARASRLLPSDRQPSGLWRYQSFLPIGEGNVITLGEGGTPLCRADRLADMLGLQSIHIKDESRNPTWSYKDRLSTVAISYARQIDARVVATSSSGNAGASLAAYAAKAGLACIVLTFEGAAGPLLDQIRKYGAMVLPLRDQQDRWPLLERGVRELGWYATSPFVAPVVGSHPVGIEGYKTIAYEIFEQLGNTVPDWLALPVAYGDAMAGIWRGFKDLKDARLTRKLPKLAAIEVYGSLEQTLATDEDRPVNIIPNFRTAAISIGTSQGSYQALKAVRESNGAAVAIGDVDLQHWQDVLAGREGLLGELSAVVPLAGIKKLVDRGLIAGNDTVVSLLTASGLKDLDQSVDPKQRAPIVEGGFERCLQYLSEHYAFDASNTNPAQ